VEKNNIEKHAQINREDESEGVQRKWM